MWLQFYHVCRKENVWRLCQLTVEGDTHVGRAVAAAVAPNTRIVVGLITQKLVFNEVQRQFPTEFAGLDPLRI